ncbi:MAG TPA: transposase [Telluria sp.]
MRGYRQNRVPGGTFFFTVRLRDRRSALLTEHVCAFGEAIRQARARQPFHIDAWVVLPDHAHAIWTLPPGDDDCAGRWRTVKIAFSKALHKAGTCGSPASAVWKRHYQQHRVASEPEYCALVDYVHMNPMRHGLCQHAADWPWSSLHRFVRAGLVAPSGLST